MWGAEKEKKTWVIELKAGFGTSDQSYNLLCVYNINRLAIHSLAQVRNKHISTLEIFSLKFTVNSSLFFVSL